jgi:hypothetical protein
VSTRRRMSLLCFALVAMAAVSTPLMFAQTTAIPAQPAVKLQPYTTPDQSASAGIPAGWKVTKGGQTVIVINGPQGESIALGNTFVAKNAPFQAGQKGPNGADLSMPFATPLQQKLSMIFEWTATASGNPSPQLQFKSATPIQVPPVLGQCGRFVASITAKTGPTVEAGAFCSLPMDSAGFYKNVMLLAQGPPSVATQEAALVQAVFASYKVPASWMQKKLAPYTQVTIVPSKTAGVGGGVAIPDDTSSECFDLVVLRETPKSQLPRACGGTKPD